MSKRGLIAVALAGLVAGCGVGLYLGLPILAERFAVRAVERVARSLGQEAAWSRLAIDGYERVAIDGFVLRDAAAAPGEPPLLQIERIDVSIDPSSVLTGQVRLREVAVVAPRAHAVFRSDGTTNFARVAERLRALIQKRQAPTSEGDGDSPFRYIARALPELTVSRASLVLSAPPSHPSLGHLAGLELKDGELQLRDESLVADELDLRFSGSARIEALAWLARQFAPDVAAEGSTLDVSGRFAYPSKTRALTVALRNPVVLPVGTRLLRIGGLSASVDGPLRLDDVSLGMPGAGDPTAPAALEARRIELAWTDGSPPLDARTLSDVLRSLQRISIVDPELRLRRFADGSTNVADLVAWAQEKARPPNPVASGAGEPARASAPSGLPTPPETPKGDNAAQRAIIRLFAMLQHGIEAGADVAYAVGTALPSPEIAVTGGTIHYADERWLEAGYEGRADRFALTTHRLPNEPVVTVDIHFRTPDAHRGVSENSAKLRVHLDTRDVQVELSAQSLPLAPYAPLIPDRLVVQGGAELHHTRLHVIWSAERRQAQLEGSARIRRFAAFFPALSESILLFPDVGGDFTVRMDSASQRWDLDHVALHLGKASMQVKGHIDRATTAPRFELALTVPETPCQDVFDGLAPELVPVLEGLQIAGTLSWSARVRADSADWSSFALDADDVKLHGVKVTSMGRRVRFDALRGPFLHEVEEPDGSMHEFMTGPGSNDYVMYSDISPWMAEVITTTEDSRFFRHRGFSPNAIRESIQSNLKKARFVRGASTVTQQLSKNLYLSRSKTVARKLQEAIIAWQIEEHLTKTEILELYFNIIEFGPSIYGIKRAAHHYFRKHPRDLELLECLFLASLIPSPKRYYAQYERGEVTDGWKTHLRFLGTAMLERGKIDQAQFDALGEFSPRFWNSPERPDDSLAPELDNLDNPEAPTLDELPTLINDVDQGEPGILFDPEQRP